MRTGLLRRWLLALLLFASSHANPALDIFDEAAYHLTLMYAGPAEVRPRDLLPDARAALAVRCGSDRDCPVGWSLAAIADAIAALGDEHTGLLPAIAYDRLQLELAGGGSSTSFGLVVRAPENGLGLVVIDVLARSSAAEAGVRRGDRILKVAGAYLPPAPNDRYLAYVVAEAEGSSELLLLRAQAAPFSVNLTALPVALDRSPTLTMLDTSARSASASGLPVRFTTPSGGRYRDCCARHSGWRRRRWSWRIPLGAPSRSPPSPSGSTGGRRAWFSSTP